MLEPEVRVCLDLTAAFEGGYASYQTYDAGIVSYGRFQFTLASGSLFNVVNEYVQRSGTGTADEIRARYLERLRALDRSLQDDTALRDLLTRAADDPEMQAAQDLTARRQFWDQAQELSVKPRNVQTLLGQALIFDMAINHGPRHDMLTLAEERIGVPPRSRMPENGGNEHDLITALAEIRQGRMHHLASRLNLEGLRVRGDFWVSLVAQEDWGLMGDEHGMIHPKFQRAIKGILWYT